MKFNSGSKDFENPPAGSHAAVCVKVIDIGTQPSSYQGKPAEPKRKLRIFWELAETMADGRPFLAMQKYTASLHKKAALRRDVESWTGIKLTDAQIEGFSPRILLGKPCLLGLVESDDGNYVNVKSIMKLPKEMAAPKPVGELIYFDLDNFDAQVFSKFSEKTKATIMQSPEYQRLNTEDAPEAGGDHSDDIPF